MSGQNSMNNGRSSRNRRKILSSTRSLAQGPSLPSLRYEMTPCYGGPRCTSKTRTTMKVGHSHSLFTLTRSRLLCSEVRNEVTKLPPIQLEHRFLLDHVHSWYVPDAGLFMFWWCTEGFKVLSGDGWYLLWRHEGWNYVCIDEAKQGEYAGFLGRA